MQSSIKTSTSEQNYPVLKKNLKTVSPILSFYSARPVAEQQFLSINLQQIIRLANIEQLGAK